MQTPFILSPTMGGGVKVLNDYVGERRYFDGVKQDKIGRIVIGDNVYIGTGAYIMPGVCIGDNVIIGANAVVTRNIPSDSVAVGMPAGVIETIEEYYEKSMLKGCFYPSIGMSEGEKKAYLLEHVKK